MLADTFPIRPKPGETEEAHQNRIYAEAWKLVCAEYTRGGESLDVNELLCVIGDCRIIYGDPNAARPMGVIDAK